MGRPWSRGVASKPNVAHAICNQAEKQSEEVWIFRGGRAAYGGDAGRLFDAVAGSAPGPD